MAQHAILSASGSARWAACPGSVALEAVYPNESSSFADEGTAAHAVAELALTNGNDAAAYVGRLIPTDSGPIEVTAEMAAHVQTYVDYVRSIPGELMVEQRLSIAHLTGEADACGTSDAVVLATDELVVADLKYGRGVKVDAERNEQLAIYASAALRAFEFLGDFKRVRLVIVQPRINHISEWTLPIDGPISLRTFELSIKPRAAKALQFIGKAPAEVSIGDLEPGEKQCRFCRAKATCPALAKKVESEVGAEFEAINTVGIPAVIEGDNLDEKMAAVDLIEGWCKAVRAEVERRLLAGIPVKGYKLVEGRRGARRWADVEEAEAALKTMRLKESEMYDFTLISPTTAEKLAKEGAIGPRQWPKLQCLITQSEGKPSVAPASDKRPAISVTPTADEFDNVTDTVADLV